jgi:membrane-associated phospholipid phosphatase
VTQIRWLRWSSAAAICVISASVHAQVVARQDRFGDVVGYVLLPAAAVALTLQKDDMDGLWQLGYAAVLTKASTEVLKHAVKSKRPDGTEFGFPSGHTSIAFASAAYVHERYGLAPSIPMYALAALTGYSRVRTHQHFTKDVVGGAAVGILSARITTHPFTPSSRVSLSYAHDLVAVTYSSSF